jgi:hypothetical protein
LPFVAAIAFGRVVERIETTRRRTDSDQTVRLRYDRHSFHNKTKRIWLMSSISRATTFSVLMGATLLASPLIARAADTVAAAPTTVAASATSLANPASPRETVEQRIAELHTSLAITPSEEADWTGVSKAMRAHAAVMDKLLADKSNQDPSKLSAVEDLQVYERFAQAHVEGLKAPTASFDTLYKSMPDAQKKVAHQVFQNFGHEASAAHG